MQCYDIKDFLSMRELFMWVLVLLSLAKMEWLVRICTKIETTQLLRNYTEFYLEYA